MSKRLISSIILGIMTIVGVIYYPLCGLFTCLLIVAGLYEFYYMVEKKGVNLFKLLGILVGVLIPITIYFRFPVGEGWQFLFAIIGIFILFLLELTKKQTHQSVLSISATVFGVIYISWCFSFLIRIRQLPAGALLTGFLILVTKSSDIGAYLWGNSFGRTPLIQRISPKKSLEGAIGGFFTCLGVGITFSFFIESISFWEKFFLIVILAIIAQLGDLFESLIKRDCGVKDSGTFLPGMGGVLDVIDSLIFTAPTFYLFLTMMR
ncbi:MAG: phosphatidate cytidylyltransferase [Candidatus Omnitrophica bacterium]|jgi:phosphatidate cytidylyltransferase|nr:phosphatidate cytidylyltransferase [Candidatus Omnitrophota bacterium]